MRAEHLYQLPFSIVLLGRRYSLLLETEYRGLSVSLSRSLDLQKQLNRSRYRLGCGFGWAEGSMCCMVVHISTTWRTQLNHPCALVMWPFLSNYSDHLFTVWYDYFARQSLLMLIKIDLYDWSCHIYTPSSAFMSLMRRSLKILFQVWCAKNSLWTTVQFWLIGEVSEWVSSFLTAHQHIIGYSVP